MIRRLTALAAVTLFAAQTGAQIHDPRAIEADPATATGPIAPRLVGLGDHHMQVTAGTQESQFFFDQGLRLTYAFNHSEALRSFKEAARLDATNAMAYWGWALVLGPNLNLEMQPDVVAQAYAAIQRAQALSDGVSDRERRMIAALAERYTNDPAADRMPLDHAYAEAMRALARDYPDDSDIATLFAASLMNLSPWDYWYADRTPKTYTEELIGQLERVIEREPNHAGALHYYIHAVEAHYPEWAEAGADRLADLMPGAGHILHMPSHIYMRVGRYADSFDANVRASLADESYITQCRAQGLYPLAYYPHNVHFLAWSAMSMGRSDAALEAARKVADNVPAEFGGDAWMLYQTFLGQPLYTMVRFGMWDRILDEPRPRHDAMFLNGVWRYARGLAYANSGDLRHAEAELETLREIRDDPATEEQAVGLNAMPTMLAIIDEILAGEIASRRGDHDTAIARLSRAVRLEDGLTYNEPPDWYFPVRHYLGAALLDAGLPGEAEVIYWQDLRRNPENGFSLYGLQRSLAAQGKTAQANDIAARFDAAWAGADVALTSSRY